MTDFTAGKREQIQSEIAAMFAEICETVRVGVIENHLDDPMEPGKSIELIGRALLAAFACGLLRGKERRVFLMTKTLHSSRQWPRAVFPVIGKPRRIAPRAATRFSRSRRPLGMAVMTPPKPELTEAERAVLHDKCWAPYTKVNALLHAACDVAAALHISSTFAEPEFEVLRSLLVVIIERCIRRGVNPGAEIVGGLAELNLPPLADPRWQDNNGAAVVGNLLNEYGEIRSEAPTWAVINDRVLRALAVIAAGTAEDERAYFNAVLYTPEDVAYQLWDMPPDDPPPAVCREDHSTSRQSTMSATDAGAAIPVNRGAS